MMGDGGLGEREVTFNLADTYLTILPAQNIHHLKAYGVGKGFKHRCQVRSFLPTKLQICARATVTVFDGCSYNWNVKHHTIFAGDTPINRGGECEVSPFSP